MPRQNRVTPLGELIADPARGLVYGNRGCLHDAGGQIRRRYAGKRWIACRLRFRGWHRQPLMQPGRFTELFFLDEATAFAAGHRPCAECNRERFNVFKSAWPAGTRAADIDRVLHEERIAGSEKATYEAPLAELPDGVMIERDGAALLVRGDALLPWSFTGYGARLPRRPRSARSPGR